MGYWPCSLPGLAQLSALHRLRCTRVRVLVMFGHRLCDLAVTVSSWGRWKNLTSSGVRNYFLRCQLRRRILSAISARSSRIGLHPGRRNRASSRSAHCSLVSPSSGGSWRSSRLRALRGFLIMGSKREKDPGAVTPSWALLHCLRYLVGLQTASKKPFFGLVVVVPAFAFTVHKAGRAKDHCSCGGVGPPGCYSVALAMAARALVIAQITLFFSITLRSVSVMSNSSAASNSGALAISFAFGMSWSNPARGLITVTVKPA